MPTNPARTASMTRSPPETMNIGAVMMGSESFQPNAVSMVVTFRGFYSRTRWAYTPSPCGAPQVQHRSHALNGQRDALPAADTHGDQAIPL